MPAVTDITTVYTGGWFHDADIVDEVLATFTDGWFGEELAEGKDFVQGFGGPVVDPRRARRRLDDDEAIIWSLIADDEC